MLGDYEEEYSEKIADIAADPGILKDVDNSLEEVGV